MERYIRKCPRCKKDIEHRNKYSRNEMQKENRLCGSCAALQRINKFGCNEIFVKRYATKGKNVGVDNAFYGQTHTKETRQKLKEVDRSQYKTPEFRQKMSEVTRGEKKSNVWYFCL